MNKPSRRFTSTINQLDVLFRKGLKTKNRAFRELCFSSIVVKLHDQWNYRSRQIVWESYGKSEGRMMMELRRLWSTKKRMDRAWEPDWHITTNTIRAAQLLNVAEFHQIQNALGAVTYIDDVRWTRNAIVHNIPQSFFKFRNMALNKYQLKNVSPFEIIIQTNPKTGNAVYQDWCDELSIALANAK